ncbi:glycosyltransferase family 2 protein [Stutzerimonas kirkiae]|nr:glycosyltransferase [Stutzerimonas kirkiae]
MNTATSPHEPGDAPLISIVVPCFNAMRYLDESLRSIYAQDYPNFEVIVVDDGSSDGSLERLRELQAEYDFQLFSQTNAGVSAALNHGLQHARGVYVATPDLDDIMLPHSLGLRARYLDEHPEVGCVGALVTYIDPDGRTLKEQSASVVREWSFEEIFCEAMVIGAPVSLYRMDVLRQVGFYDPQIRVQDFQMTLRISAAGHPTHVLPVVVTRYRRHPNNLSRNYRVLLDADLKAIEPYRQHPLYERGRVAVINKALKYAVVQNRRDAWRMICMIPWRLMDRTTLKRARRLLFHRGGRK